MTSKEFVIAMLADVETKKKQAYATYLQLCGAEDAANQILKSLEDEGLQVSEEKKG